jgi:thiamine-monophosphate kinase
MALRVRLVLDVFRSETEFVRWLRKQVPGKARGLRLGIGDDAAVVEVEPHRGVVLKSDMCIENVHFNRGHHPPFSVGHRSLTRPLSDLAAIGAVPRFALVSLALSRSTPPVWIEEFYAGLLALAMRFGVTLVGGDVARMHAPTVIDVIVTGEVELGTELRRSGAKPGDRIFVSGELGLAALGLRLLRLQRHVNTRHRRTPGRGDPSLVSALRAQLYPEPRCKLGRLLSTGNLASATIDLSDGLSTDLHHLCEASGVGARVSEELLPVPLTSEYPRRTRLSLALHGGEDYQLLFTVPSGKEIPASLGDVPLRCIGEIRRSKQILLIRNDGRQSALPPGGYDHFRHLA